MVLHADFADNILKILFVRSLSLGCANLCNLWSFPKLAFLYLNSKRTRLYDLRLYTYLLININQKTPSTKAQVERHRICTAPLEL